jgi:peptide/nickel transport system permease protein
VAIPETQLIDVLPVDLPEPEPVRRSGFLQGRLIALVTTVIGIALIVLAGWGIRSSGTGVRVLVAAVGAALIWRGLQQLGSIQFGPTFRIGYVFALAWLTLVIFCAVFADWLPIEHWRTADLSSGAFDMPPALRWPEPLGRTTNGYSNLSHVIYGARTSLMIGAIAVLVGLAVGLVVGLLAGWYGKSVDAVIGIATNSILAFPPLILLLAIVAVYGSSVRTLALGLAVISVPTYTRLMRAQTLAVRQREFVLAARAMGASNRRLMWKEVLPNALLPVVSYSFIVLAAVIVAEGTLSYLGVGVPSPQPSWGGMIAGGQRKLKTDPHLVFVPAAVMFLTVLSFNRVGEVLRHKVLGGRSEGN